MKKTWTFWVAAIIIMLSACSQTKDIENTPTIVIDSATENSDGMDDITEMPKNDMTAQINTNPADDHTEEQTVIGEIQETKNDDNIDYEILGIQKYEYPSEFSMGENLKTAITQLALSYDNFGKDSVSSENWKEIFIARFIQNSRVSFDYLDMISDKNDGQISVDQLNYIQYSLTNTELDFASEVGDSINRNDAASSLNYGWISEYNYEETNDGVIVTADFETGYDGTDSTHRRKITVELIKNPYSCFDGYSVITVSSEIEN